MKVIEKNTSELVPYERNPRQNDDAVAYVANSIKEFGFKVPIVIDKNNVIIAGHTRLKAAKELRLKQVPCIIADDLTDEQVKAFRLADNKVSEFADWDMDMLSEELDEIIGFDMSDFGFEFEDDFESDYSDEDDDGEEGYYGDERERTYNRYNLKAYNSDRAVGFYDMPMLEPCYVVPDELIGFNYVLNTDNKDAGVHFFLDDYQFERVWDRSEFYIEKLAEFDCVLTPDFSLYLDMPMSMKIWNTYRSRLIGQMMQDYGISVIPTVSWAEEDTFRFCFDGLPEEATLAISTIGVKTDEQALRIWKQGMDEMIKRLNPKTLIVYGGAVHYDYKDAQVINYNNDTTERMNNYFKVEEEEV